MLATTPCYAVLSLCIFVGACVCPISYSAWRAGITYLQLINIAPSSASAADEMTALIILVLVKTDPLLSGKYVLLDINKCPPTLLLDLVLERY